MLFSCLLRLQSIQQLIESGELTIPHLPKGLHPVGYLCERRQLCFAISFSTLAADNNQPALCEHFDMLRDRGTAHLEILCDGVQVHRLAGDKADDIPSDRIGDRLEYIS